MPASGVTLALLPRLGDGVDAASRLITTLLGIALILTAIAVALRRQIRISFADRVGELEERRGPTSDHPIDCCHGGVGDANVSRSRCSGGTLLLMLYPRLPVARIVGSDIACAVPLTLLAAFGHWILGSIDCALLRSLLVGSPPSVAIDSLSRCGRRIGCSGLSWR